MVKNASFQAPSNGAGQHYSLQVAALLNAFFHLIGSSQLGTTLHL